ncbi:Ig-like domain-containing protein [Rarobacter incanus]|uniref:Ig-like domain-containing protein n=1 Tax=Rarobacter incanus TaxID=153494 RepID=UPI001B8693A2|nr:hypothetical protein [Rarobacter incanus]
MTLIAGGALIVAAKAQPAKEQVPRSSASSVWVSRDQGSRTGPLYGLLDTSIEELTNIQPALSTFPKWIVQGATATVLVGGDRYLPVDPALPPALSDETTLLALGVVIEQVQVAGEYVALLDDAGNAYAGTVAELSRGALGTQLNSAAAGGADGESAIAVSVTDQGVFSALTSTKELLQFDSKQTPSVVNRSELAAFEPPASEDTAVSLATFGEHWAALVANPGGQTQALWLDDVRLADDLPEQTLLGTSDTAESVLLAGPEGLASVSADGLGPFDGSVRAGVAVAAPRAVSQGCAVAAWVVGTAMVASQCDGSPVALPGAAADPADRVVLRTVGSATVLNDATTGATWILDAAGWTFVASSVEWNNIDRSANNQEILDEADVADPQPPTAPSGENARFGVRPGSVTSVPVLIGATDPNPEDVITIVPGTIEWAGESPFPVPEVGNGNTSIVVDARDAAQGGGTLTFDITDGSAAGGHQVKAAIDVSVHPFTVNEAPREVRIGGEEASSYAIAPDGVLNVDVARYWVDPDGDDVALTVLAPTAGTAVATAANHIVYRPDAEADATTVAVKYSAADGRGAERESDLSVSILESAKPLVEPLAVTAVVGVPMRIAVADAISGVGDRIKIALGKQDVDGLAAEVRQDPAELVVTAKRAGSFPALTYEVTSGDSFAAGVVRVTAVVDAPAAVVAPPIRAFVSPGTDTQIDILAVVPNPGGTAVALTGVAEATATPETLSASGIDVQAFDGSSVRVAADFAARSPAYGEVVQAGSFTYSLVATSVTGRSIRLQGSGTVYLTAPIDNPTLITRTDTVQIAAGQTADVSVLDNDMAEPGVSIQLDPRPRGRSNTVDSGTGLLAFAAGSVVRILAPLTPGTYTVPYYAYPRGYPAKVVQGSIVVTVRPAGGQSAPDITRLIGQVSLGGTTTIALPGAGGDPDGDETYLAGVEGVDPQVARVEIDEGRRSLTVESKQNLAATPGGSSLAPIRFTARVEGGSKVESVPVVVSRVGADATTVAFNDYRYEAQGSRIEISPLQNDVWPGGQQAILQSVERVDTVADRSAGGTTLRYTPVGDLTQDRQSFAAEVLAGRTTYRYTVVTGIADSTGDFDPARERGVQTGEAEAYVVVESVHDSVPQYPRVQDTYVSNAAITGTDPVDSRPRFTVDVITDKVTPAMNGRRIAVLTASQAQGSTDGVRMVSGTLTAAASVIAFELESPITAGSDYPVVSYGFVRVPAADSLRPERRNPQRTFTVREGGTLKIDLAEEIVTIPGQSLELVSASPSGVRAAASPPASCAVNGTTLTYTPGTGSAAVSDDCTVTARWRGTIDSATTLRFAITVVLIDEPPAFTQSQIPLVVRPGGDASEREIDLTPYIRWEGASGQADRSQLAVRLTGDPGDAMVVEGHGRTVAVTHLEKDARPQVVRMQAELLRDNKGFSPAVTVSIVIEVKPAAGTGPITFADATVNLRFAGFDRIVQANSDVLDDIVRPELESRYFGWDGGAVHFDTSSCKAASAALTCTDLGEGRIGITVDPGTEESPTPSFAGVRVRYSATDSSAASGRTVNTGSGFVILSYDGVPSPPKVAFVAATATSVTLRVAANARDNAAEITRCRLSSSSGQSREGQATGGECEITVSGLTAGKRIRFTGQVSFGAGWSAQSSALEAWAYAAPAKPIVTWKPVAGAEAGLVDLNIVQGDDGSTRRFEVYRQDGTRVAGTMPNNGSARAVRLRAVSAGGERIEVRAIGDVPNAAESQEPAQASVEIEVYGVRDADITAFRQVTAADKVSAESFSAQVKIAGSAGIKWAITTAATCVPDKVATAADNSDTVNLEGISPAGGLAANAATQVTFCAVAFDASPLASKPGLTSAPKDRFGGIQRQSLQAISLAINTDTVQNTLKYDIVERDGGYAVELNRTSYSPPGSAVELTPILVADPGEYVVNGSVEYRAKVRLRYKDQVLPTEYSIGSVATNRRYIPGPVQWPALDAGESCTQFQIAPPTLTNAKTAHWTWSIASDHGEPDVTITQPGSSVQDGLVEFGAAHAAGDYVFTATVTFRGPIGGLSAVTHTFPAIACAAGGG